MDNTCLNLNEKLSVYVGYSAEDIAKYVISYCNKKHYGITANRLQLLLFFIQGETKGNIYFNDPIYAYADGPYIARVYEKYKKYGNAYIVERNPFLEFENGKLKNISEQRYIRPEIRQAIEEIVDYRSGISDDFLLKEIKGMKTWEKAKESKDKKINKSRLKREFEELNGKLEEGCAYSIPGETICWHCKKPCLPGNQMCSWMKDLTPVKGWDAEKTDRGYLVKNCPLFERNRKQKED